MEAVVAILLIASVILAVFEAVGIAARVSLGWLAVATLAAAFAIPAVAAVT